ncbi:MAG: hypothetical protein LUD51_00120 [Clostridia bacterium]|nr:hypothetical protein [Clostridia bacterium]
MKRETEEKRNTVDISLLLTRVLPITFTVMLFITAIILEMSDVEDVATGFAIAGVVFAILVCPPLYHCYISDYDQKIAARKASEEAKSVASKSKAEIDAMLANATVEKHYPDWFGDIKPADSDDTCGLQVKDGKSEDKPVYTSPSSPVKSYPGYSPEPVSAPAPLHDSYKTPLKGTYDPSGDDELVDPYVNPAVQATKDWYIYQENEKWVKHMLGMDKDSKGGKK